MGDDTEIRRLTKEAKKRREQTEILNRRVHRLTDFKKPASENREAPPESRNDQAP